MKFSWKICLSTILISLIVFSLGGYVLISALFQATYDREIENAIEENQMLQYSFSAYWNTAVNDMTSSEDNVRKTVQTMLNAMNGNNIRIRITNKQKEVLYDNTTAEVDSGLLDTVTADTRGYMIRESGEEGYELQTASVIQLVNNEILYLESIRDVTAIFKERDNQYSIYRLWLVGVLVVESFFCYIMTLYHLRQLRNLTRAASKIADGDLSVRAPITNRDELGELATSFNHMADNLEHQFLELEDVARRQEDFIGSFAHEIKTPLTSIIGYADMLCTRELQKEEQFQAANYIFKEGKRLEALSLKLLDLLVIRNEELELKPVYIKWMAEDIKGMLQPYLKKQGITLKVIMEDVQVFVEPDLMKTVLINLLDNARKATEGQGTIYLLGRKEEKGFALYVRDTGKGIPQEELSRITEAFYMVDKSRSRRQGGAGLGLSIVSEIIQRHNGNLEFKSSEGKGTIVRIFLPEGEDK